MNLILISTCLKSLDIKTATTSSEKFELNLILNLKKYFKKVNVFSLNNLSTNDNVENIELKCITHKLNLIEILKKEHMNAHFNTIVLFFGYDYFLIKILNRFKKNNKNCKIVSFTFDTHKPALLNKNFLKKLLLEVYFNLGIRNLNKIDGIILFKKEAYKKLKLRIPYLVSKVGINNDEIFTIPNLESTDTFNLFYAGSLESYNGIDLMMETMKNNSDINLRLYIYGDGSLRHIVENNRMKDSRIIYNGSLNCEQLLKEMAKASLLLNFRDLKSCVNDFAFPSKVIECMASGIPLLTTRVIKDDDFSNATFILDAYHFKDVNKAIDYIQSNPQLQKIKSKKAQDYLINNHDWKNICKDLYIFLEKLFLESE